MPVQHPYRTPHNQRLDPEIYQTARYVTFITIRAYTTTCPFTRQGLCQMVVDTLRKEQDRLECTILAFCLMPDHLHYLIQPNRDGVSVMGFTDQFKGKTTNRSWTLGWQGKLWQPRYFDQVVRLDQGIRATAEYVFNNPVRKEWVSDPEDWPWSECRYDLLPTD